MVEHLLAKEKAAGSNPVFRSILPLTSTSFLLVALISDTSRFARLYVGHYSICGVGSDTSLLIGEGIVAGDPTQIIGMGFA